VIVLSLALLAAAAVFLVVGILRGDGGTVLLVASIVSTLGAAVLLYFGVRPRTGGTSTDTEPPARTKGEADRKTGADGATDAVAPVKDRTAGDRVLASVPAVADGPPGRGAGTTAAAVADRAAPDRTATGTPPGAPEEDDPPDEPRIEAAQLGDLARVAGRDDEVLVVDGRPRYHVAGCAHLTDRESEGLPVSEAAELGFTPCARCAPVATLLG
jgi:hypothetical protein